MHKNEKGFASIVIALVLIIVLALFTIGFAQLARREQQTALDSQKATQAQYAAESGINNAYKDILSGKITENNANSTNCMKAGAGPTNLPADALSANQDVNTTNGVSYSCLLVALHTDTLQIDRLSPNSGRHMMFNTDDPLSTLTIKWGSYTNRTNFVSSLDPNNPQFGQMSSWTHPPLLEISITPVNSLPAANTDAYLQSKTFTFYAYPSQGGSNSVNYDPGNVRVANQPGNQGQVVSGACSGTGSYPCSVNLTNLGGQQYVIHITDFYDTSNILMTAGKVGGGTTKFTGEPMIDVTGKARDVLKRLRVRLFINGSTTNTPDDNSILPNNALEAQDVCKRIQTAPPTADFPQGSTYDTGTSSSCDLSN
ncbi:MAG TPA: PilX N-terminal domain-containing pilus assembly protein [Candidatus Saccharimonadales bacterium]|nr:PilX N-terminal domain-containing pilus assembly protein [Candidatus Saccharimonadales bacterium]